MNNLNSIDNLVTTDSPQLQPVNKPSESVTIRGFNFGKYRISHLRTNLNGWSHDEGAVVSTVIFGFDRIEEHQRHIGYRIVMGCHAFTICV
jgi:hypothetical protein